MLCFGAWIDGCRGHGLEDKDHNRGGDSAHGRGYQCQRNVREGIDTMNRDCPQMYFSNFDTSKCENKSTFKLGVSENM